MASHLKWLIAFYLSFIFIVPTFGDEVADQGKKIKFETKKIVLDKKTVTVEIAENDTQHEYGLMLRTSLPKDHGMLFIFPDEEIRTFWMKNTLINLSIGYFDKDKKLIDIQEMKAVTTMLQKEIPTYPSLGPAMYALEMTEGWFMKNKINKGAHFKFVK